MSTWVPPASIPALNDGDPLPAKPLKDLVASLQSFLNGEIGNPNINVGLDPTQKIAYAKLDLAGQIQPGDIVSVLLSSFSTLKVRAQSSPNNTVFVEAGLYPSLDALSTNSFAGGSTGAFVNTSGAGQRRIDVVSINDAGVLNITPGIEAGAPVPPDYPASEIPLAEIYIRFNGGGVVIRNADNTVDSYVLRDIRPIMDLPGVPDDSITVDKFVDGATGLINRVEGTTDLADPGTSFVTMTGMTITGFNGGQAGTGLGGCLLDFDATFELRNGTNLGAFPTLEVRLMVGDTGFAVEVHRVAIGFTGIVAAAGGDAYILPLHLSYQCAFNSGGLKDARIEWRRVGTSGTPTVRQIGATYKRVLNMTTIRRAVVAP